MSIKNKMMKFNRNSLAQLAKSADDIEAILDCPIPDLNYDGILYFLNDGFLRKCSGLDIELPALVTEFDLFSVESYS